MKWIPARRAQCAQVSVECRRMGESDHILISRLVKLCERGAVPTSKEIRHLNNCSLCVSLMREFIKAVEKAEQSESETA